jgi:hypothetical protein
VALSALATPGDLPETQKSTFARALSSPLPPLLLPLLLLLLLLLLLPLRPRPRPNLRCYCYCLTLHLTDLFAQLLYWLKMPVPILILILAAVAFSLLL